MKTIKIFINYLIFTINKFFNLYGDKGFKTLNVVPFKKEEWGEELLKRYEKLEYEWTADWHDNASINAGLIRLRFKEVEKDLQKYLFPYKQHLKLIKKIIPGSEEKSRIRISIYLFK